MKLQLLSHPRKLRFIVGYLRFRFLFLSLVPLAAYSQNASSAFNVKDGGAFQHQNQNEISSAQPKRFGLIKYSGIWLSGKYSDADRLFPIGKGFAMQFNDKGDATLSQALLRDLRAHANPEGSRIIDVVAPDDYTPDASTGEALVMACAINYEHVDGIETVSYTHLTLPTTERV